MDYCSYASPMCSCDPHTNPMLCWQVLADDTDLASNNVSETGFLVVMNRGKVRHKLTLSCN